MMRNPNDTVQGITVTHIGPGGGVAQTPADHKYTIISITCTSLDDSHHFRFPVPITRAELYFELRGLAERLIGHGKESQ